jgi:uncharacterized membrane protein YhiD involved in acid resistance
VQAERQPYLNHIVATELLTSASMTWLQRLTVVAMLVGAVAGMARAQAQAPAGQPELQTDIEKEKKSKRGDLLGDPTPDITVQLQQLRHALTRLPFAVALASVLALRPRRRGTPPRQAPVIQTQIILAIVGALVMLVVGSSLARAFGIVGAAGLVRYRARIADPKDAGVMLSTLALGLASGVGLWMLAGFSTLFILLVLWIVESFEPKARQPFLLKVKAKDSAALRPKIEELLTRHRIEHELRLESKEEITFEVQMPINRKTDTLSDAILKLDPENARGVEWDEKKVKS